MIIPNGLVYTPLMSFHQPATYMAIRIAIDLNLFEIIAQNPAPTTLDELVKTTKADPSLIKRIIRVVNAIGFVKQTDATTWEATPLTHTINAPPLKAWMIAHFDKRIEIFGRFPEWLKDHEYKTTWASDEDNVAFEIHDANVWEFYDQNPEASAIFDMAMSIQENFPPEMTPPYPFVDNSADVRSETDAVTLVDVGGGAGQAIGKIKQKYPNVPGKFILQDLPKTIENLAPDRAEQLGFEPMVHNFFDPQPIKGAKYYHLRRVLHDWNDELALKILSATKNAMDPTYSRLLINEFVLPDVNAGSTEAVVDLIMMTTCDGKERTESDWGELLGKAGFKIEKIWRAEVGTTAVIEASVA
jgi:demethylsterigmatocystin 6-O-methyltransferase